MRKPGRNKSPGLLRRAVSYTEAVIEWTAAYDRERKAREVKKCIASGSVRGLEVDYVVLSGTSGETIVSYAQENDCTLIAIATHGHGGFRRFALGSTADFVVHHSLIPVLTVRP